MDGIVATMQPHTILFSLPMKRCLVILLFCTALAACSRQPTQQLIGVMIDNHEDARAYQRGLEKAPFVEEQLVEGFITRFIAFFDPDDLPESVGPVRSVRPYFIDGSAPLVSAIFHVGGSPEALEKLEAKDAPESFNAISGYDAAFDYDDEAPAPHNRFLSGGSLAHLLSKISPTAYVDPGFQYGGFTADEPAPVININYYNPVQNVTYTYDKRGYVKTNRKEIRPPSPKNILILETDVEVVGPVGRLGIVMEGSGKALLFRDGGMKTGTWTKTGSDTFFTFTDKAGEPLLLRKGQIWMIILDDLDRVSWKEAS